MCVQVYRLMGTRVPVQKLINHTEFVFLRKSPVRAKFRCRPIENTVCTV